jgi:hypothetical protein
MAAGWLAGHARGGAQTNEVLETCAWQFPIVTDIVGAEDLVGGLRAQVQRVLDAGRLAPLYISFADQESVGYSVYQEPGRIVTTLAWAYPHLTPGQQSAVRAYVNAEFDNPTNAPWGVTSYGRNHNSNYPLPHNVGTPREDHPKTRWWYERADFGNARPFLHTLYGVWLYGFRTGDWAAVSNHWSSIKSLYANYGTEDAYRLYGTWGVHIAMARLADRFGDTAMRATALTNLQSRLDVGLDFATVEAYARGTPGNEWRSPYGSYPNMYDARMDRSTYRGWVFLNLTPEAGRYLRDASPTLRSNVLARHNAGKTTFPLWWMPKASYFNRSWTGDEGSGLVPEVVGMLAPVERWVVQADAATLRRQTRGAPNGLGDCYWLEALVQAIEAHGVLHWSDVRRTAPVLHDARLLPTARFRFTVTGAAGQSYVVQHSNDLTAWTDLLTNASPFDMTNETAGLVSTIFRAR